MTQELAAVELFGLNLRLLKVIGAGCRGSFTHHTPLTGELSITSENNLQRQLSFATYISSFLKKECCRTKLYLVKWFPQLLLFQTLKKTKAP